MRKTVTNTGNVYFVLNLLNSDDLNKLFFELKDNIQMNVLNGAFRKAGKVILDAAKTNFNAIKKGFSKTGYSELDKGMKIQPLQNQVGVKIGMQHREGYKYRFINDGTKERQYQIGKKFKPNEGFKSFYKSDKLTHSTGMLKPTEFFDNAVDSQADTAQNMLSDEIVLSLERCVRRYEKKAGN